MENNTQIVVSDKMKEKRKNIEKKVLGLEKLNYNQKDYTTNEMVNKIKKIIEEEISKWFSIH